MKGAYYKDVSLSSNPLLRLFYHDQLFLSFMCVSSEVFFCALYLCYFTHGPVLPLFGMGVWKFMAVLTFPVAALKIWIYLLQLTKACHDVVAIDIGEREELAKLKQR